MKKGKKAVKWKKTQGQISKDFLTLFQVNSCVLFIKPRLLPESTIHLSSKSHTHSACHLTFCVIHEMLVYSLCICIHGRIMQTAGGGKKKKKKVLLP